MVKRINNMTYNFYLEHKDDDSFVKLELPFTLKNLHENYNYLVVTAKDELDVTLLYHDFRTSICPEDPKALLGIIHHTNVDQEAIWNQENGHYINHPGMEEYNLKLIKLERKNYDSITSKDVPDNENFRKDFEHFNQYSFKMNEVEYLRYKQFVSDHRECRGGTSVTFTGTGIGTSIECKCSRCRKSVDIADIDSW